MSRQDVTPMLDTLDAVPVFPLPDLVIFPGADVPLHFFEPRYRALAEDVVRDGGLLATVQVVPEHRDEHLGRPPICAVGTLTRVLAHRRRPDGTHDVVLRGLARGQLEELEPSERGYRRARVRVVPDVGVERVAASAVSTLVGCANTLAGLVRRVHADFSLDLERIDGPADLVDRLAHRVVQAPEDRQRLLETADVRVRLDRLLELLGDLLLRVSPRGDVH